MITREQLIDIGIFNKTHGVNGELQTSLDVDCDVLSEVSCVVAEVEGIFVPFFIEALRTKGSQSALLTIDGITTDVEASLLVGKIAYVLKRDYEALSDEADCDEMPLDFFIGFTLADAAGVPVGKIVDVNDATANVLFEVERPSGDVVNVPAADELVTDIDTEQRVLCMDLPDGLLEL